MISSISKTSRKFERDPNAATIYMYSLSTKAITSLGTFDKRYLAFVLSNRPTQARRTRSVYSTTQRSLSLSCMSSWDLYEKNVSCSYQKPWHTSRWVKVGGIRTIKTNRGRFGQIIKAHNVVQYEQSNFCKGTSLTMHYFRPIRRLPSVFIPKTRGNDRSMLTNCVTMHHVTSTSLR